MSALEFGHRVGNLCVVAASISSLVGKRGICEWLACLIPILLTKGSHVSHFEVNQVHPM